MHRCPITSSKLTSLFARGGPNDTMLFATLEGRYPGWALVDDPDLPSQAIVRTHYGTTFFGGRVTDGFLANAVDGFRLAGAVRLVVSERDFAIRSLPAGQSRVIKRLEFPTRKPSGDGVGRFLKSLPGTCRIVSIDRGLFARCSWHDEVLSACGTVDRFMTHCRSVCLMRNDEILSEAYAIFMGAGRAELGAITKEEHRGRNYAAIACAHLIEGYDRQGIPAYWSCHQTNTASIGLARKLGFRDEQPYRWIRYEASGQADKE